MRVFWSSSSVCACVHMCWSLQVCPTLSDPGDCSLPCSSVSMGFSQGKNTGVELPFLRSALPGPRDWTCHVLTFPALASRPFTTSATRKPLLQCRSPLIVIAWDPGPWNFLPFLTQKSKIVLSPYFYLHSVSKAPGGNRVCCPLPQRLEAIYYRWRGSAQDPSLQWSLLPSNRPSPPRKSLSGLFFLNLSHQYPVEHGEETEIEGKFIFCLRLPRVWYCSR